MATTTESQLMDEQRHNYGRRNGDNWIAKASAVAVILGTIYAVAAWGIPLAGLPKRVDVLEAHDTPLLYMTCVLYRDAHPNSLPAPCDQAISRGTAR